MVISDLYSFWANFRPYEAYAPLFVDSDAVFSSAVILQGFKVITWRRCQVCQFRSSVEHVELTQHYRLDPRPPLVPPRAEQLLGVVVSPGPDHAA